jgi:hypothetical protein
MTEQTLATLVVFGALLVFAAVVIFGGFALTTDQLRQAIP